MQPPPEPTELERQVRKLRLEVRRLKFTVVGCAIAVCLTLGVGNYFGPQLVLMIMGGLAAGVLLLYIIAGSARKLADGWDALAMRWQRHKWQAERNKPVNDAK
ncbi:MAG TPA: hypothetical protein VHC95_10550 [Opitutales bacterium]|nr:hypothetical protein [Opitutales bacterium]